MIKDFRAERTFKHHVIHIKELRLREVNDFTQGHTANCDQPGPEEHLQGFWALKSLLFISI